MLKTCSTPDRGYMGDPARGASLGRGRHNSASIAKRYREDIQSLSRTLANLADPACAYLFAHLDRAGRADLAKQLESDLREARERLAIAERAAAEDSPKFHLRRVKLDSGGYDPGGAYWGLGDPLFEAFTDDGCEFLTMRIGPEDIAAAFARRGGARIGEPGHADFARRFPRWHSIGPREAAKDYVREEYPGARFFK